MGEITSDLTAAETFDADRAMLMKKELFRPLVVLGTEGLAEALTRKKVAEDSMLLLLEREGRGVGPAHARDDLPSCGAGRVGRETVRCDVLSALL